MQYGITHSGIISIEIARFAGMHTPAKISPDPAEPTVQAAAAPISHV